MYSKQTDKTHYSGQAYRSGERWTSYWHQLELVRGTDAKHILEVGVGAGIVARELRATGVAVTTLDIAEDLHPDKVGSVTAIPFPDGAFDAVLAAEILEHIRFEDVPRALQEIARVAKSHAIISVPHPGYIFSIAYKVPLLPKIALLGRIPFFWKTHAFNGEHYWELGKRGYSVRRFLACAREAGLELVKHTSYADDPAHRFFLFAVKP